MKDPFWRFLGVYTGLYLLICLFEILLLSPLVDFFGNGFWIRFLIYCILFLLANPFLVKVLGELIFSRWKTKRESNESE